jgi:hypothetical protein
VVDSPEIAWQDLCRSFLIPSAVRLQGAFESTHLAEFTPKYPLGRVSLQCKFADLSRRPSDNSERLRHQFDLVN